MNSGHAQLKSRAIDYCSCTFSIKSLPCSSVRRRKMSQPTFADTGLDPRLLRALAKRGFTRPTPVQLEAIPKTLEGKDIVAR
jgi:superfamily II DNA/RNA helicase